MPGWLSRNNFSLSDFVHASDLNNLANDNITWGGDVNGGGYHLSNVILQGSGGFSSYVSPVEVTPGSTGSSCVQLDQTVGANHVARWTVCKDTTAESGGNTGSNFGISRYTDAGVFIDSPIAINRATGLITMGAQQWNGAVNGGGQTLSNVVIPGTLADPTRPRATSWRAARRPSPEYPLERMARSSRPVQRQRPASYGRQRPATGVPTSRNIFTGLGLTGGGSLAADLTIAGIVMGASGASHAAGLVPDAGRNRWRDALSARGRYLGSSGWRGRRLDRSDNHQGRSHRARCSGNDAPWGRDGWPSAHRQFDADERNPVGRSCDRRISPDALGERHQCGGV